MSGAAAAFKKRAYLLIEVDPGNEASLIPQLEKMENVTNVDFVHGEYDIVCVLEGTRTWIKRSLRSENFRTSAKQQP